MTKDFSARYTALDRLAAELGCGNSVGEPLAPYTTFRIGGPADRLITVETQPQLAAVRKALAELELPVLVLGRGSDLLVGDKGFRGAVLRLAGAFRAAEVLPDGVTVRAGSAASLASVCALARERGLTGLEFAWGIPGSVGGAVYMNAGAYGGEVKDVALRSFHVDVSGASGQYSREEMGLSYRHSAYTNSDKVITFTEFGLSLGDPEGIAGKMEELMARRKAKQPYDMPSAGSTFKRPKTGYAAALIEQCGLKGRRVGGAQVSEKHAGFIVNTGGATSRDVLELMEIVWDTVRRQTGVELEPEVRIVGEM